MAWLSNAIYLGRAWLLDLKTLALKISWPGWPVDTKQPGEISWSGWPIERRSINLVGRIKFLFRLEFVYINLIPWLSNTLYLIFLFLFFVYLSLNFLFVLEFFNFYYNFDFILHILFLQEKDWPNFYSIWTEFITFLFTFQKKKTNTISLIPRYQLSWNLAYMI